MKCKWYINISLFLVFVTELRSGVFCLLYTRSERDSKRGSGGFGDVREKKKMQK